MQAQQCCAAVMTRRLLCLTIVTLFLCSTATYGAAKPADDPRFRFNPPDGATFTVKGKATVAVDDSFTPKDVELWQFEEQVAVKRTQKGYSISRTPVSVTCRYNERTLTKEDMPDYLQVYLTKNTCLSYDLGSNGQAMSIGGYNEALEKAKVDLKLKPEDVEALTAQAKLAEEVHKAIWNFTVRALEGRSAKPGNSWSTEGLVDLPMGPPIKATYKYKVVDWVQKSGKKCSKVSFTFLADGTQLSDFVEMSVRELKESAGETAPSLAMRSAKLTGRGEIIVDPATMLYYGETDTWKLDVKILVDSVAEVLVTTQKWTESAYTYK